MNSLKPNSQPTKPRSTNSPRTSTEWKEHFARTCRRGDGSVLHRMGAELSDEERAVLVPSIQEFQIGEQSEGRNLMRFAKEYADKTGDRDYPEAIRYFILEENRHAKELQRFLESIGEKTIRRSKVDRIFSSARKLAGLELSITVLVTAEIIAAVYYDALARATGSLPLRKMCEGILEDEDHHIQFQFERLGILQWNRPAIAHHVSKAFHRMLLALTLLVIWPKHGPVFRMGGFGFWKTAKAAYRELGVGFAWMDQDFSLVAPSPDRRSNRSFDLRDKPIENPSDADLGRRPSMNAEAVS